MKFYNHYVTCNIQEGITFSIKESRIQTQEILNHFDNKPFVYITHRINSYAVDPSIYSETSQIENLIGFAVVSKNELALSNVQIESIFLKKTVESFKNLDEAKKWANNLVENHLELK